MSTDTPRHSRYDAVVVGARCAGAGTALLLAREGLRVLVVDRSRYGADTLSTHALMRGAVLQLQRWGLLDAVEAAGTPAVRATSFHYADEVTRIPIKSRGGIEGLYAPRRDVLDRVIVDGAREAGAEVVYGARLVNLARAADGRVDGVVIEDGEGHLRCIGAGIVIGADGLRSTVADLVKAQPYRTGRHSTAVVFGYFSGLADDGYHWHYRPGVSVGIIPTNERLTCVFASMPSHRFSSEIRLDPAAGFDRVLEECSPRLAQAVAGGQRSGNLRGFPGQVGLFRQSWGRGWALVGDAAYFKDPITAHGITDALRDAELLARAVVEGSEAALAEYQSTRDAMASGLFDVTDEIASFAWDLSTVKNLHLRLSQEMKREVAAMQEWREATPAPARRSA
ncbi:MAG: NAD(P)/FAD-dependent oxidoreductase [Acidobacteriota bacterium]|jgi:2-polyprenyl-6-methoxyphenol hydroxylase-like FAD-dependent oxidoreductase